MPLFPEERYMVDNILSISLHFCLICRLVMFSDIGFNGPWLVDTSETEMERDRSTVTYVFVIPVLVPMYLSVIGSTVKPCWCILNPLKIIFYMLNINVYISLGRWRGLIARLFMSRDAYILWKVYIKKSCNKPRQRPKEICNNWTDIKHEWCVLSFIDILNSQLILESYLLKKHKIVLTIISSWIVKVVCWVCRKSSCEVIRLNGSCEICKKNWLVCGFPCDALFFI